jgi:hypothetical protein
MVTGPISCPLFFVVSTLLGTTHEVVVGQFGPVITIRAVAGSKLPPLIVNENDPVVTVVGERLLMEGAAALTVSVAPLDSVPPEPFCTRMVKLPASLIVTGPTSCPLFLVVSTLFGTTHEVVVGQFGPVITIRAVAELKLLPLTVSENDPVVTVVGEILLIEGLTTQFSDLGVLLKFVFVLKNLTVIEWLNPFFKLAGVGKLNAWKPFPLPVRSERNSFAKAVPIFVAPSYISTEIAALG